MIRTTKGVKHKKTNSIGGVLKFQDSFSKLPRGFKFLTLRPFRALKNFIMTGISTVCQMNVCTVKLNERRLQMLNRDIESRIFQKTHRSYGYIKPNEQIFDRFVNSVSRFQLRATEKDIFKK